MRPENKSVIVRPLLANSPCCRLLPNINLITRTLSHGTRPHTHPIIMDSSRFNTK